MEREYRTAAQITEHYGIEKELAIRLRNASKEERRRLYSSLYDELYRRVPHHPQLTRRSSESRTRSAVRMQLKFLRRFLNKNVTFLEIGPGDCALSFEVSSCVKQVYAVDVSGEIAGASDTPRNFRLILSDGCNVPVPTNSVDVAYSNQLMEHLHPDDAYEQLRDICRVLSPGGIYACITPNRLTGPHDVSKYFDVVATGFHLKEYTISELRNLMRKSGFSHVRAYLGARGTYVRFPVGLLVFHENLLSGLPDAFRRPIAKFLPFRVLLNIQLVGVK